MMKLTLALYLLSTIAAAQSLSVELQLTSITVEGREFNFKPPAKVTMKLKNEKPSGIVEIGKAEQDEFGVGLVYHVSFVVVSAQGENPRWKKTKVLEIEFYRRDPATRSWQWFYTAHELVAEKMKNGGSTINSFTYDDEKLRKQYRFKYEFLVQ